MISYVRNYLRVRGEYPLNGVCPGRCWELPPRARRIHPQDFDHDNVKGTTSACAENTPALSEGEHRIRNYLRVRGEYVLVARSSSRLRELPPRARRIPLSKPLARFTPGTTSACAENTTDRLLFWCRPRNYLRVRGEYISTSTLKMFAMELPPRARRILRKAQLS